MRKEKTLFILGLWIVILPFLGFPNSWRKTLFVLSGFAVVYLSYLFYLEAKRRLSKIVEQPKNFVDSIENKI